MANISLKRAPYVKDDSSRRAIEQIYDDINELINAVNTAGISAGDSSTGKTGDIRIQRVGENKYRLEGKTEEGWVRPGGVDSDITSLTDSTGGTASNTIAANIAIVMYKNHLAK